MQSCREFCAPAHMKVWNIIHRKIRKCRYCKRLFSKSLLMIGTLSSVLNLLRTRIQTPPFHKTAKKYSVRKDITKEVKGTKYSLPKRRKKNRREINTGQTKPAYLQYQTHDRRRPTTEEPPWNCQKTVLYSFTQAKPQSRHENTPI